VSSLENPVIEESFGGALSRVFGVMGDGDVRHGASSGF